MQDRVAGKCTDRDTWQERGEEEEIARADDGHIVFERIEVFEKRSRGPSTADNDDVLLRRVVW